MNPIRLFQLVAQRLDGLALVLGLVFVGVACSKDSTQAPQPVEFGYEFPAHFPPIRVPDDNHPTPERIALGKRLFFDPMLSKDRTVSCASCHHQELAFADNVPFSIGIRNQKTLRNSMPLHNIGWHTSFFWDGGVRTLELQTLAPIENPLEMDLPLTEAEQRLREHPDYPALFRQAYGREPDLFGLTRALAAYQRSLISARSPYDRYLLGDSAALDADQKAGKEIFFSERAECFHCHAGVLFSDFSFQNNGLYEVYPDSGRAVITGNPRDVGRFKVPSLRNVALTSPYMHDGSLPTLESVIDHYISGGRRHRNKSHFLRPFDLNENEKRQLIAFLHSLTDSEFITDPRHRP